MDFVNEFDPKEKLDFNYEDIRKEARKYTYFEKELLSFITTIY